jgi:hypothetical protein
MTPERIDINKPLTFLLAIKALIDGDVDVIATNWSRMTVLRENNRIIIDHQFSSIIDEFELEGWHLIPRDKS